MTETRGRPIENTVKLDKWKLDTGDAVWYYDIKKSANGCYKVVQKVEGKQIKPEINERPYGKNPVVMVFKSSNRSNARTKIKVFNKNIDYIITVKKLPGVPEQSIILDLGVGKSFINEYKQKYNLA
jgi:hypothetical protein